MATPTRKLLTEKIDLIKTNNPGIKKLALQTQVSAWLDTQDLSNISFTQEEARDRILSDLGSYPNFSEVPDA